MEPDKENTVYFYDYVTELTKKEDICLNNFEISEFKDNNGLTFLTNEHFYQAHKFLAENIKEEFKNSHEEKFKAAFEEIRLCPDPLKCKKAARAFEKEFENEWNKEKWSNGHKDYIMRRGLMFKFSQHKNMLDQLMLSENKRLVEESYKDPYWGGMLPDSKNKLGDFLKELRDNYRETNKIYLSNCDLEPIVL